MKIIKMHACEQTRMINNDLNRDKKRYNSMPETKVVSITKESQERKDRLYEVIASFSKD